MKLTYKGDYALKAILHLAFYFKNNEVVPLTDISDKQNIPVQYLEQIMLILKNAGYVDSKRGKGGGFFLSINPNNITLGEIIRLVEGPIEPIVCGKHDHDSSCGEEDYCAFREVWVKVTKAITSIVDDVTFLQIMGRTKELQEKYTGYMYQI
jgi:Rrf2 family protein